MHSRELKPEILSNLLPSHRAIKGHCQELWWGRQIWVFLLAVWPCKSCLTFLSLSFPICESGLVTWMGVERDRHYSYKVSTTWWALTIYMIALNIAIIKGPVISKTMGLPYLWQAVFAFVKGSEDILIFSWCLKLLQQDTPDYSIFMAHWKEVWYKSWVFHCECNSKYRPYLPEEWIPERWGEECL